MRIYHKNGSKTEGEGLHILSWEKILSTICMYSLEYFLLSLRNSFSKGVYSRGSLGRFFSISFTDYFFSFSAQNFLFRFRNDIFFSVYSVIQNFLPCNILIIMVKSLIIFAPCRIGRNMTVLKIYS